MKYRSNIDPVHSEEICERSVTSTRRPMKDDRHRAKDAAPRQGPTSVLVSGLPLQNALVDMSLSMKKLPSLLYRGVLAGLGHSSCSREVLSNICVVSQDVAGLVLHHCMTSNIMILLILWRCIFPPDNVSMHETHPNRLRQRGMNANWPPRFAEWRFCSNGKQSTLPRCSRG